jgi:hypothetical protein
MTDKDLYYYLLNGSIMNRGPDQCNGVLKYFKPLEDVVMN